MKNLGIKTLRFNNNDIINNIEGILEEINNNL
jgi:very-short-patch-repair endonuclease